MNHEMRVQPGSFEIREDRRVSYCYVRINTRTPVRTLPDIITGEVRDTVVMGREFRRFVVHTLI